MHHPHLFEPLTLREVTLRNRIVVSPMCQYQSDDGFATDWHLVHLGARATGGAGLVLTEMTDVEPQGRITHGCAGLWNDTQRDAWKRVVDFVHAHSPARIGIQLAHAGRKASCALPWDGDRPLRDGSATFQATFSAGPHFDGSPFSALLPSNLGPRHCGQFSANNAPADTDSKMIQRVSPMRRIVH